MEQIQANEEQLNRVQQIALIVGAVALVIAVVGAFIAPAQFYQSYLYGYIYWVSIGLGCLAVLMVQYITGGRWGFVIRRFAESGAMTLPLLALLFIPILFGIPFLYEWAQPEHASEYLIQHKQPYLNVPFFIGRAIFYFLVWIGLAYLLNRWSLEQDKSSDTVFLDRLKTLSPFGIILYMLTATFAAFDWMMSLEPEWFSSIYGVLFVAGHALTTFAFVIILAALLAARNDKIAAIISRDRFCDLGNFLLGFVCFWAYIGFSQYLILYQANLPETVSWYITRTAGGWQWLAVSLIFLQFAIPFLLLLSRRIKRNIQVLTNIAILIVVMRIVELFWLIMPAFHEGFVFSWISPFALVGIGGLWIWFFLWQLKGKPLFPINDPRYQEVADHG